jgi:hypothetical protein
MENYKVMYGDNIAIVLADNIKLLDSGQTVFTIKDKIVAIAPINSLVIKMPGGITPNYI